MSDSPQSLKTGNPDITAEVVCLCLCMIKLFFQKLYEQEIYAPCKNGFFG